MEKDLPFNPALTDVKRPFKGETGFVSERGLIRTDVGLKVPVRESRPGLTGPESHWPLFCPTVDISFPTVASSLSIVDHAPE